MEYLVHGDLCFSTDSHHIETMEASYLHVKDGKCISCYKELPEALSSLEIKDYSGNLIIPGMVDLHLHAPQYAYRGTKMVK